MEFHFDQRKIARQNAAQEDLRTQWASIARQRRTRLQDFANSTGKWLLLKQDIPIPVRCLALANDHLWVEISPGLEQAIFPEEILTVLGDTPPTEADLALYRPLSAAPVIMEPNQALALANVHFPAAARLRKVGYRLDQHVLVLTFDFPGAAGEEYSQECKMLEQATGWQVELTLEANQNALNALVREVLPVGWQIVRGPAIHSQDKRVAVTVSRIPNDPDRPDVSSHFWKTCGYKLDITFAAQSAPPVILPVASRGEKLEINAAYTMIKTALAGSTLYRTSLKGNEIVLSFISPQVGERYHGLITELSQRTGWPLSINPNSNQGTILEIGRSHLNEAGWIIQKGPGIFPEKAEVAVGLSTSPTAEEISRVTESFLAQTGFRLVVTIPQPVQASNPQSPNWAAVEIPLYYCPGKNILISSQTSGSRYMRSMVWPTKS